MAMRFIHTADVHLSADAPHRLEVFREICALAADCDALVVAGDLFHSGKVLRDRKLLADLREALAGTAGKPVLLIAGNHEHLRSVGAAATPPCAADPFAGLELGGHVFACGAGPADREVGGVRFRLVPFQRQGLPAQGLRPAAAEDLPRVAVLHGTAIDRPGLTMAALDSGDDEDSGDCLLRDADLAPFRYAALGHIHRRDQWSPGPGCVASYPGSPDMVSSDETEERTVNRVTLDGTGAATVERVPLRAAHRALPLHILLLPGLARQAEERARLRVAQAPPGQVPVLRITGFAPRAEAAGLCASLESAFRSRAPRPIVKNRVRDSGELEVGAGSLVGELFAKLGALEERDPVLAGRAAHLALLAMSGENIPAELAAEDADAPAD
ncbi:MAG: hypothetical protein A2X36_11630 [Elusimicrobia bacterium GWA2_69_24]|nr:MAG: hypothetical protein A2X36_11630 [Elusimicrobia bacterium GWA2_69_24]